VVPGFSVYKTSMEIVPAGGVVILVHAIKNEFKKKNAEIGGLFFI